MIPLPSKQDIKSGDYPQWEGNSQFEKDCLRHLGLPEDFHPDEEQAYNIMLVVLED